MNPFAASARSRIAGLRGAAGMPGTIIGRCQKPRPVRHTSARPLRHGHRPPTDPAVGDGRASGTGSGAGVDRDAGDPLLSPDSITYLSVADHVRSGHGLTDFTGEPLAVFGPCSRCSSHPADAAWCGPRSSASSSIAAGSALMGLLMSRRVRPAMALAAALAFAASHGFVRMASVVWSEAPYAAIALGTLLVLHAPADHRSHGSHRRPSGRPRLPHSIRRRRLGRNRSGDDRCIGVATRPTHRADATHRGLWRRGSGHQFAVDHPQPRRDRPATGPAVRRWCNRTRLSNDQAGVHRHRPHRRR